MSGEIADKSEILRSGFLPAPVILAAREATSRTRPELLCPQVFCAGSPLPVGRVALNAAVSGYIDSGFAIVGGLANDGTAAPNFPGRVSTR